MGRCQVPMGSCQVPIGPCQVPWGPTGGAACFVTSGAPRAATELSFGPSCSKFRVEADAPSPDPYLFVKNRVFANTLISRFRDFEKVEGLWGYSFCPAGTIFPAMFYTIPHMQDGNGK